MRILSASDEPDQIFTENTPNHIIPIPISDKDLIKRSNRKPSMNSIPEEDLHDLTDHIADVSLHETEIDKRNTVTTNTTTTNNNFIAKRKRN